MWVGVTISLACYFRPSWLLAAPLFSLGLILKGLVAKGECPESSEKNPTTPPLPHSPTPQLPSPVPSSPATHTLAAATVLLGTFLALAPWGLRNLAVLGHFKVTCYWMGPSLYDGLNPTATGDSDMTFFDRENLSSKLDEIEVDRIYTERAWQFVRENPKKTVELAFAKLWRYWKPWPNAQQFQATPIRLALIATTLPLFLLSLFGLSRYTSERTVQLGFWWFAAITVGPMLYFSGLHMLFVSSLRYRLPAEYVLFIPAALGLRRLLRRHRPNDTI